MKNRSPQHWYRAWMWRGILLILFILSMLWLPSATRAQGPGTALQIPPDQRVEGNIATFDQSIEIAGEVSGDVTSWSGDIAISGHVGGDVVSYAGHVSIAPGGRVDGSVLALGGGLDHSSAALVAGQVLGSEGESGALASLFDLFTPQPAATTSADERLLRLLFGVAFGVFLLAFSLILTALLPRRTAATALTLRSLPLRSLALGLLTTLFLLALAPFLSALLAATLIGLPITLVLLVVLQVSYVYGLAALIDLPGLRAPDAGPGLERRSVAVAAGLAALIGLFTMLAPLDGLLLFYVIASPGLGAAILSRGGLAIPRLVSG